MFLRKWATVFLLKLEILIVARISSGSKFLLPHEKRKSVDQLIICISAGLTVILVNPIFCDEIFDVIKALTFLPLCFCPLVGVEIVYMIC